MKRRKRQKTEQVGTAFPRPYKDLRVPSQVFESLTQTEFASFFPSVEDARLFFEDVGLVPTVDSARESPHLCPACKRFNLKVEKHEGMMVDWRFVCSSPSAGGGIRCRFTKAPLTNTWFSRSMLDFRKNLKLLLLFCAESKIETIEQEADVAHQTACDYVGFCKEVYPWAYRKTMRPIGGVDWRGLRLGKKLEILLTEIQKLYPGPLEPEGPRPTS